MNRLPVLMCDNFHDQLLRLSKLALLNMKSSKNYSISLRSFLVFCTTLKRINAHGEITFFTKVVHAGVKFVISK
jgi:hypothetical protein